ncbi:rac GTPase-activating protein 1 isoform X2 [Folsomia candida]|uniref:rac GTPase-activating protein 1 isoform X2 n=1 Tax=Folsomia candida TaxID=158441 RepID=UPI000B90362D|nr:rac GTPase-activating protein 1 isoform X2 [Folsomia candida]
MLSKLAVYDELIRHYDHYCNQNSTKEFLEFVNNQENCRQKWEESETECTRLQNEVSVCQQEITRQERKIQEVRRHLESKMEIVNKLELENERIELRNNSAKSLVNHYLNEPRINPDMKERLLHIISILENGENRDKNTFMRSPAGALDTISEVGSTDLSMTQSEDDLDVSGVRTRRQRARSGKRQSLEKLMVASKKARKSSTTIMDSTGTDKLIAKTVVSFPRDGHIHAVASLETVPGNSYMPSKMSEAQIIMHPSAPPLPSSESESEAGGLLTHQKSPVTHQLIINNEAASSSTQSPRFGRTLSSGGAMAMRPHAFCQKTVIKPETCEPCGKRIKFSKLALKCRDCKATCHPECKDKVPLPCVVTGTPSNKTQMGTIADYAPLTHPMVPGLVQHCVNEVEVRGFETVGLYRVPGPEKEVKELKERFLKGKGIPNLSKYDIHAVCGCIKDFLRSIQEPLIGKWFWRDFALASEISDRLKRQAEIDRIIHDLPPANQDTLAFVILHLQRVGEVATVKMPASNLAKVFGPTIVGYSGPDIDAKTMLRETRKQQAVLEALLSMPQDFWTKFVYRQDQRPYSATKSGTYTRTKGKTMSTIYSTPQSSNTMHNVSRTRESGRKIYFTDESPKDTPRTRQKRNFFD